MATLWEGSSSGSPVVYYTVTADTERNGKNIRIKFNINASLGDYSYIYTGHTLHCKVKLLDKFGFRDKKL